MAGEYTLSLLIKAQNQASGVIQGFLSSLGPVGGAVAAVGAAAIGVGVASVKMAADFQQNMNKVQALTGSSNDQMKQYDASLKALAINAGVAPTKLADGLYNVMSAGYKGKDAMNVLTLATEDAKIGMTSAAVTSDALTNVMASFSVKASDATRVNGQMLETVTLGKATFEQYATTIVKSASSASQFGVSMETMNAAWATMTSSGIRAAQASTDFQQSLKVMYGNIGTVTKSLHSNGIAFNETAFNAMDYGHKVQYLNTAVQQANDKHVKVTGVTLQAAQAISTISQHIGAYNSNLSTLSNKQAMAQKTAEAWKITQGGFNQTMSRLSATVDVVMISIGQKLLPVVTNLANQIIPVVTNIGNWLVQSGALNTIANVLSGTISGIVTVVGGFAGAIKNVVTWFINVKGPGEILRAIIVGIGAAFLAIQIGSFIATIPALVAGFLAWAGAAGAAAIATLLAMAPLILIGIAIAAAVAIIVLAVTHWGAIMDWISGKTEQLRIKNEQKHAQMALDTDRHTAAAAKSAIANAEKERVGILEKLKQTHDPAERAELEHQLKMTNAQIKGQQERLQKADQDAAKQKAKQKQLHDDMIEAQKNWFQRMLDSIGSFFGNIFSAIGTFTHNATSAIGQWFGNVFSALGTFTHNCLSTVGAWFGGMFSALGTFVNNFLSKIGEWKDQTIAKITDLVSNVRKFFTDLPGEALQWGENLITGFINGIKNMIGAAGKAASDVVDKVKGFLGFHSPAKEGPGSDADQWAPNLMKMYAKGIQGGMAGIKVAVKNAAALMKDGFTGDANILNQKINAAQYQLYLDKVATYQEKYQQREAQHHEKWLAAQQKRYEKYLEARNKALEKYDSEKHHKKAFSYHDFKIEHFKALKERDPKFTGLALGAFANKTTILDPSIGNGTPMQLAGGQTTVVNNITNLTVHGSVVDHSKLLNDINKLQDKNHRLQGTHVTVTSGGRAR